MDEPQELTIQEKMRLTMELAQFGLDLMRQNLRRRHPDESEAQIDERFLEWQIHRPGAEHGDGWGIPGKRTFLPDPPAGPEG